MHTNYVLNIDHKKFVKLILKIGETFHQPLKEKSLKPYKSVLIIKLLKNLRRIGLGPEKTYVIHASLRSTVL